MRSDLLMLYGIIERYLIHLEHLFIEFFVHQGTFTCLGSIFARPFITHMIRGMGFITHTRAIHIVGGLKPSGMATMFSMGVVEKWGNTFAVI